MANYRIGRPPELNLQTEKALLSTVLEAIQSGLVRSAHDLSEGGLAVALAESCISGNVGAQVNVETALRADHALFSESQSRGSRDNNRKIRRYL